MKKKSIFALLSISLLSGCAYLDRLTNVGDSPKLTAIENPTLKPGYKPVSLPMPPKKPAVYNSNSLWRNGARTFFNDQRARGIGDILTVLVSVDDKDAFENETKRSRSNTDDLDASGIFGIEKQLAKILPKGVDLSTLVKIASDAKSEGSGSVDREETLTLKMAAVVVQRLPNGNLVIEGKQEIRVNFEVREIIVAGIIRPEDISAANTIPIEKIAEARVAYGGRGQITDVQQPRYGQQVMDILLPF